MKNDRISIHICTKNRPSELALLLQSLRTQTLQDWDLIIVDDASGTPVQNYGFIMIMIQRIKLEGHRFKLWRNDFSVGVCKARNKCIEIDEFNNEYACRLDDDVVAEPDYLAKLKSVLDAGFDIASGTTPPMANPDVKREVRFVMPIINEVKLDGEGNVLKNGDDCGYDYLEGTILPTHHFRSCALYRTEITDKGLRYEANVNFFREEQFFSFRAILMGYKIGIHTQARVLHQLTGSGGNKDLNYSECVKTDEATFLKWVREVYKTEGDFLVKYNEQLRAAGLM